MIPERLLIGETGTLIIGLLALFVGMRVRRAVRRCCVGSIRPTP